MYKLIFFQEWKKSSWEHFCDKLDNSKMRIEIKIWKISIFKYNIYNRVINFILQMKHT